MTRLWAILLIGGALTGCATVEPNPWESIDTTYTPAQQPVEPPYWPIPDTFDEFGATYTIEQLRLLDIYREAADANYRIAQQHAAQIDALNEAVGSLVDAGKGQRVVADMRRQMLEEERRHNAFEKVGLWILVLALGGAATQ